MDTTDFKRLSLYLDGQLGRADERALEKRLSSEAPLRVALDSLRSTDRWLRDPETWSAAHGDFSRQLSSAPVGAENAELGALRSAIEAHEEGSIPAASESLLKRIKARGTPSRSRSGRSRRKSSVRVVRRSGRTRLGSGSGSARIGMGSGSARVLRRGSSRISARQSSRRPSATGRVSATGRANAPSSPWSAWAGLLAAACIALVAGGLVFGQPKPTVEHTAKAPAPTAPVAPQEGSEPAAVSPELEPEAPTEAGPVLAPDPAPLHDPEAALEPGEPSTTSVAKAIVDDGGRLRLDSARLRGSLERYAGAGWEPLADDAELAPGQRLRATAPSFASLDDGAYELCLDAGTELLVRAAQDGPVLELERGRLLAEVVSLRPHERFEVRTGPSAFQVLGTVFEVGRDDSGSALGVLEGAVRASHDGESLVAPAGHGVRVEGTSTSTSALQAVDTPQAGAWAKRLRAERRVAWSVDFEGGEAGFAGEAVATPARGGNALALGSSAERAWARGTAAVHSLKFAPDLYLQLSVFSEVDASVMVRFTNASQEDRPFMATYALRAGQWRTLTIPFEALSTLYDPALNPLKVGDRLTQLEVLAGDASSERAVLIDDVQVYRKHYR